jgi:prophage regulatory protein
MKIYRFHDLKPAGVPFSKPHLYRLEKEGKFPKRFPLGANSVAWVKEEVDQWLADRIASRDAAPAEVVPLVPEPVKLTDSSESETVTLTMELAVGDLPGLDPIFQMGRRLTAHGDPYQQRIGEEPRTPARHKTPGRLGRPPGSRDRRPRQRRQAEEQAPA